MKSKYCFNKDGLCDEEQCRCVVSEGEFANHDCHASPEDGCEGCELYRESKERTESAMKGFSFDSVIKQMGAITKNIYGKNLYE